MENFNGRLIVGLLQRFSNDATVAGLLNNRTASSDAAGNVGGMEEANKMSKEIKRVFPDYEAYGFISEGVEQLNRLLPLIGREIGYGQLSGSIADGSFACASRRKRFDLDFTFIISFNPLVNPTLLEMENQPNYVELEAQPGSDAERLFKKYIVTKNTVPIVSPNLILEGCYSPTFRNVSRIITGDPDPDVPDDTWYELIREIVTVDVTPAIVCRNKNILNKYRSRERRGWPPQTLLDKLPNTEFYLVPKSLRKQEQSTTWRLSFSSVEPLLFKEMSDFQRRAYAVFKLVAENIGIMYFRSDLLTTYHLKTVFLWSVEKDCDKWTEMEKTKQIGQPILHLFQELNCYLKKGHLPFYFDEKVSLFNAYAKVDVQELIDRTRTFIKEPKLSYVPAFPFIDSAIVGNYADLLGSVAAYVVNIFFNNLIGLTIRVIKVSRISDNHANIGKAFVHELFNLVTPGIEKEHLDMLFETLQQDSSSTDFMTKLIQEIFLQQDFSITAVLNPAGLCNFPFADALSKLSSVLKALKGNPMFGEYAYSKILQGKVDKEGLEIKVMDRSRIKAFHKCIEHLVFVLRNLRCPAFD